MKIELCFYLVLAIYTSKTCSYTLEEVVKDSFEKGLKTLTDLKSQLPDNIDEHSGEFTGPVEKDYTKEMLDPEPVHKRRSTGVKPRATTNTKTNSNCSCVARKQENSTRSLTDIIEIKEHSDHDSSNTTTNESNGTTTANPTPTLVSISKAQLKETHFELEEIEFQLNAALKDICPHFKKIPELDIQSMADVWQLAYYKAEHVLYCFKIFLKKMSPQSRKRNKVKFTSFNNSIDWQECQLELGSTGIHMNNRRHFLQGSNSDHGVLENIVLSQTIDNDYKIITLEDQSPDQWLVSKNVLLMRDCNSGDVVIFTRITFKPDKKELEQAMYDFGENGMDDTVQCRPRKDGGKLKQHVENGKYNTLS